MNKQEEMYLAALSADRAESADMLEKPSMRGIKRSVVEKYSDQAHFIYELLQNADDAKATTARFILEPDKLIFAHNGSRHFSVSNPETEEEDSTSGCLGDINAITSIANSNKTQASIGKFGVGFKAVFQYTTTPYIYDPEFCFKIDRFIVPTLIEDDFSERKADETLFVFPFDHPERSPEDSYDDISDKLRNLTYPPLFLTNLKEIKFEFGDICGQYGKTIKRALDFDGTDAEEIHLTQNNGDKVHRERLWLFSRTDENQRRYSVGFFLGKDRHLKPVNEPAFCFFPTKEVTGLNFIIHAPFLLTDSREGIRAGVKYNNDMMQLLADLSADALEYLRDISRGTSIRLIDDNILKIIPTDSDEFSNIYDKRKISFMPFYNTIEKKLKEAELLPTADGYVTSKNAYWAAVTQLPALFSNKQLAKITGNENACWVFTSLGRDETQRSSWALFNYIDELTKAYINEDAIISGRKKAYSWQPVEEVKGITADFIESQSVKWLHTFYKWLSDTKHRREISLNKPFFLDADGKAVPAFDNDGQLILFMPADGLEGYEVVNPKLLKNKETRAFLTDIGVKEPSLKDYIYNIILPRYNDGATVDAEADFSIFFKYYCSCSKDEAEKFVKLLKDYKFLLFYEDGEMFRTTPENLYMPTPELKKYFASKPDTWFIDYDGYLKLVGDEQEKELLAFLNSLGVKSNPTINLDNDIRNTRIEREETVDGLIELITNVGESKDAQLSFYLWGQLCKFIEDGTLRSRVLHKEILTRPDGRYNFRLQSTVNSSTMTALMNTAWIVTCDGEFVLVENVSKNNISRDYNLDSESSDKLIEILGIKGGLFAAGDDSYLTNSQREKIALADKLKKYGIESDADLEEFAEYKRKKEAEWRAAEEKHNEKQRSSEKSESNDIFDDFDDLFDDENVHRTNASSSEKRASRKATSEVIKDIAKKAAENPYAESSKEPEVDEESDHDEFMPSVVDYSKKIERAKEKSAAEIDKIAYSEELYNKAIELTKDGRYTVAWFKTLLELESINGGAENANSKEVSISFAKVEREPNTKRTLILKHPSRYIPQFMEDLADIPLVLHMGEQKKTVAIEVASIRSYTLRVKLKSGADIDGIDLSTVTEATINAKSPVFLLEELRKQFNELDLPDDFNMKDNLCENIEFVFGPPGTGKTTHLAQNVLIPIMKENPECKVLVLTPTNKAADVLVKRIMEVSGNDTSYNEWLIRFGGTSDEEIEQSPIFKDKTFDIRTLSKNVTVTTIARFPYDFFMPQGARVFLQGMKWDYIVIDEASMIPIANIIFPLYKKTPKKFIIAGDPFQIEPITSVDLWKDENIYTMVELDSFVNPKTKPYQYKVELLTTQYRSVPAIGEIFSNFAYGGILKHYRQANGQRSLNVGEELGIKTLNIIKYPVSKYESIYRSKRLQHSSSYQIYSALFTFEYVCYLAKKIAKGNHDGIFRIGIIAPYRAQADMIEKLLASEKLPHGIDVQVGTIHGFQGDECDMIFAVFNTPPTISNSKEMFLNKRNIINVSISRAKDYLFIVMPDDNTEGVSNLRLVKRVESLIKNTDEWNEAFSHDLEESMFSNPNYLENNAFSTSHQSVNVYGLPERRYEIRTEENAVDVQIHRNASEVME